MTNSRAHFRQAGFIAGLVAVAIVVGTILQNGSSPTLQTQRVWLWRLTQSASKEKTMARQDELMRVNQIISDPEMGPDNKVQAYIMRASLYVHQRQFAMADRDLTSALALHPHQNDIVAGLQGYRGDVALLRGDFSAAIVDFGNALAAATDNPGERFVAHFCRAGAFVHIGDYGSALSDLNEAMRGLTDLRTQESQMIAQMHPDSGLLVHEIALVNRFNDQSEASILSARAAIWRGEGQYAKALADYSRAIALLPNDPKLFADRGQTYFLTGQWRAGWNDISRGAPLSFRARRPARGSRTIVCGQ